MTQPQLFRKKPVEVEAMQWPDDEDATYESVCKRAAIHRWVNSSGGKTNVVNVDGDIYAVMAGSEGDMRISPLSWIIKGGDGRFYPCNDRVFRAAYDPVESPKVSEAL